jgi:DNA-binding response OmpR family regulator
MEKCVSKANPTLVLCVDDDPRAMMARSLVLSIAGYDVQTASSSQAALSIFRRSPIDLVIADHFLPGMNGADLASTMKKIRSEVAFVLLMVAQEPPAGADDVDLIMVKGMDPQRFLNDIQSLLNRRQKKPAASANPN